MLPTQQPSKPFYVTSHHYLFIPMDSIISSSSSFSSSPSTSSSSFTSRSETECCCLLQFSEDERGLVQRMYNLVGERWGIIAGRIPGRTADEVESYCVSMLKPRWHQ